MSRCRGLIEFLTEFVDHQLELFTDKAKIEFWPTWLADFGVRPAFGETADAMERPILVVDSYEEGFLGSLKLRAPLKTVLLADENQICVPPIANMFLVRLESQVTDKTRQRQSNCADPNLRGTVVWNNALEKVAKTRSTSGPVEFPRRVVLSFGGSNDVSSSLALILNEVTKSEIPIELSIFANMKALAEINSWRTPPRDWVRFFEFGEQYYDALASCHLLICHSGTSALEAYHLGLPTVVVNLFPNALANFFSLKEKWIEGNFLSEIGEFSVGYFDLIANDRTLAHVSTNVKLNGLITQSKLASLRNFILGA